MSLPPVANDFVHLEIAVGDSEDAEVIDEGQRQFVLAGSEFNFQRVGNYDPEHFDVDAVNGRLQPRSARKSK